MALFDVRGLSVDLKREGAVHRAVDNVSFSLEAGNIYDVRGASGSGKSTLLRACALMVDVASGTLEVNGRPSSSLSPTEWRAEVCLVPQKVHLVGGTVRDNLLLPWSFAVRRDVAKPDDARMRAFLDAALLHEVSLDRDASQLSGGQAARVALLRAFLAPSKVLLLDEVDAALDDEASAAVSALTREAVAEGRACLRIRHRGPDGLAAQTFTMDAGVLRHG